MTLPSLLPLAGAAIAPIVGKAIDEVTDGLSFLATLHRQEQAAAANAGQTDQSSSLESDFVKLTNQLRERLASFGVDLTTPVRLKQDERNRVVVDGNHPDRVLIESIFGNDDELTNLFQQVADAASQAQREKTSEITGDFRFVIEPTGALIEFA